MIQQLAEVLGMDEHSLYSAVHEAARRANRRPDGCVIEVGRDFLEYSDGTMMRSVPMREGFGFLYGPLDKVGRAAQAAADALRAEAAPLDPTTPAR
jgi:hypothetical protein